MKAEQEIIKQVLARYSDMKACAKTVGDHLVIAYRDHNGYPAIDIFRWSWLILAYHEALNIREEVGCSSLDGPFSDAWDVVIGIDVEA